MCAMPNGCHHVYLIARVAVCRACEQVYVLPQGAELRPNAALLERLTPRQREAVALLVEDYTNHEIAREMGVSYNTALHFIRDAYQRCGAHARVELVAMYYGLRPLGGTEGTPSIERPIEQAPAWSAAYRPQRGVRS